MFGMRKYPTPINKPMMPFYVGGEYNKSGAGSIENFLLCANKHGKFEEHEDYNDSKSFIWCTPLTCLGVVMFFAINSLASSLMEADMYKNDPRNPKAAAISKAH